MSISISRSFGLQRRIYSIFSVTSLVASPSMISISSKTWSSVGPFPFSCGSLANLTLLFVALDQIDRSHMALGRLDDRPDGRALRHPATRDQAIDRSEVNPRHLGEHLRREVVLFQIIGETHGNRTFAPRASAVKRCYSNSASVGHAFCLPREIGTHR